MVTTGYKVVTCICIFSVVGHMRKLRYSGYNWLQGVTCTCIFSLVVNIVKLVYSGYNWLQRVIWISSAVGHILKFGYIIFSVVAHAVKYVQWLHVYFLLLHML